jgi:sulfate/thiosulfate transport system permease protein
VGKGEAGAVSANVARISSVRRELVSKVVAPRRIRAATTEPRWVKALLIAIALGFLTLFLFVPLAIVFVEALKKGLDV